MSAVDEQLARERRGAGLAIFGACLGALLPMAGGVLGARVLIDEPANSSGKLLFFNDHSGQLLVSAILLGLGALAILFPLRHLYMAAKARRPELPVVALIMAVLGCVVVCVATIATQVLLADRASEFAATGNQTYEEAKDVLEATPLVVTAYAAQAARLALGFAFVMISLNAMRVGLLTKFMGILGIIVGVLFVLPIFPGPPVVQSFWLVALAVLFAGRWPRGVPPAWVTGKAEPWPTAQELREQRERELGGAPAGGGATAQAEPEPATASPASGRAGRSAASKKRKRKKRR